MQTTSNNFKKRSINYEDEPPEKKLVSDADVYIKKLSENQRNTQTSLEQELLKKKEFYKATEFISLTEYTAGPSTLQQFNSIYKHSEEIERLKSHGLSNEDINLYLERQKGSEHLKNRKVNSVVINQRLREIDEIINQHPNTIISNQSSHNNCRRVESESRLLKFALENEQTKTEKSSLPHPMDDIKDIAAKLNEGLSPVDIKKIRKKARSLNNRITEISLEIPIQSPKLKAKDNPLRPAYSKWDSKEVEQNESNHTEPPKGKVFSCGKEPNWYTIQNGEIVKLKPPSSSKNAKIPGGDDPTGKNKLSPEEIKRLPKFSNYEPGLPSKVLYLKNLANSVTEEDLHQVFGDFQVKNGITSINVMNRGKLRGQAFINFSTVETAQLALDGFNGTLLKNKPIIIQFGKGSQCD